MVRLLTQGSLESVMLAFECELQYLLNECILPMRHSLPKTPQSLVMFNMLPYLIKLLKKVVIKEKHVKRFIRENV